MDTKIKHDGNDSYLTIREEVMGEREDFVLRMITENEIVGLLPARRCNFNGDRQIYYQINGLLSLKEQCAKKQLGAPGLGKLLLELEALLRRLEEYLLDADDLLLSPDYIYISTLGQSRFFCLYPCKKSDIRSQLRQLSEYFLEHIDHEDEEAVGMAYQLYRLTRQENFEFSQIVESLVRVKNGAFFRAEGEGFDETARERRQQGVNENETAREGRQQGVNGNETAREGRQQGAKENDTERVKAQQGIFGDGNEQGSYGNVQRERNLPAQGETSRDHAHKPFSVPRRYRQDEQKENNKKPAGSKLTACLAAGSLLSFFYTCVLKSYFYGETLRQILATKEAMGSLFAFPVFLLPSLLSAIRASGYKSR